MRFSEAKSSWRNSFIYGSVTLLLVLGVTSLAFAFPFRAVDTVRESVRRTSSGTTVVTGEICADASKIDFTESDEDNTTYIVFQTLQNLATCPNDASTDPTTNPGPDDPLEARCANDATRQHIYWTNKEAHAALAPRPQRCITTDEDGTEGDGTNANPVISADGRYVAFESTSTNIDFGGDDGDGFRQIYVHDRQWEITYLSEPKSNAGPDPDGDSRDPVITADASTLVCESDAQNNNLDVPTGYADANPGTDIFSKNGNDCATGTTGNCQTTILTDNSGVHTAPIPLQIQGANVNPAVDSTGKIIAFESNGDAPVFFVPDVSNFVDIFVFDGVLERISQNYTRVFEANGNSNSADISDDGTMVVFHSVATDLLDPSNSSTPTFPSTNTTSHVYLWDRTNEVMKILSVSPANALGNGSSTNPLISGDGRFVAYESSATNLIENKTTTSSRNIFIYDTLSSENFLVSVGTATAATGVNADCTLDSIASDGLAVGFTSAATDVTAKIVTEDPFVQEATPESPSDNGATDVFIATNACPIDTDGDGSPDCLDGCDEDANKIDPGQCGCGVEDTDTDGDGTANCNDLCPEDGNKTAPGLCGCSVDESTDTDEDDTPDCADQCPNDPTKTAPGSCGCGVPDLDENGNGAADCVDPDPNVAPGAPVVDVKRRGSNKQRIIVNGTMDTFPGTATYNVKCKIGKKQKNTTASENSFTVRTKTRGNRRKKPKACCTYTITSAGETTARSAKGCD